MAEEELELSNRAFLTDEKVRIIHVATMSGSLRPQIACIVGVSKITVWKYQKRMGLI